MEAFLQIFALASSLVRTQTFFHESQVLDALGLAVTLELGTINLCIIFLTMHWAMMFSAIQSLNLKAAVKMAQAVLMC